MAKSKINWRNHFIELLVVVIGITIAFGMENWAERKRNKESEINYLTSLRDDITNDSTELEHILDSTIVLSQNVGFLFPYIFGNAPVEKLKYRHVVSTYTPPYFNAKDGTYHSLVNSGSLGIISNYQLRASITDLYNFYYDEIARADDFIHDLVGNQIYPYMLENIRFGNPEMNENQILDIKPLQNNKVKNMIGSYSNFLRERMGIYRKAQEQCSAVLKEIETELRRLK